MLLISKVFNFTKIPPQLQTLFKSHNYNMTKLNGSIVDGLENCINKKTKSTIVLIGGTGFFEDGGRDLDPVVEHSMPDYNLYTEYVEYKINECGRKRGYYSDYLDASIGFTTRGCFRRCSFCVNKKYKKCHAHSPLSEFLDESKDIVYLWDDNFFALSSGWESILDDLNKSGKKYQFRQGLDIRLLTEERAYKLSKARYYGDFIFAFDHIQDKEKIESKLKIWRQYCTKETKLYVLCGYDARNDDPNYGIKGDYSAEEKDLIDIRNTFERISILMKYGCLPYIMRYESYNDSPYREIYVALARWCNQPGIFKKMSFKEFCERNQDYVKTNKPCSSLRALHLLEKDDNITYQKYVNLKYSEEKEY